MGQKNEIDFVITSKANVIKTATIANKVNIGSNQRMLICRVKFDFTIKRNKMHL